MSINFDPSSERSNLKLLRALHVELQPSAYLEIGVRWGDSLVLSNSRCPSIGVDPEPSLKVKQPNRAFLFRQTSDDFFRRWSWLARLSPLKPGLGLIDGMHLSEFVLRDFYNLEPLMAADGVIVLDDTNPYNAQMVSREPIPGHWTGDVWKFLAVLDKFRPDLETITFDVQPTGLTLIKGLRRKDITLKANYTQILDYMAGLDYERDFVPVFKPRVQAYSPDTLIEFLS